MINLVRKDINPLSFKDFVQTKQISNLWDKLEFDDIRIKSLKTKEEFYKWCYDFIHNDEPLKVYFRKRLSYNTQSVHEEVPIQNIKNIYLSKASTASAADLLDCEVLVLDKDAAEYYNEKLKN